MKNSSSTKILVDIKKLSKSFKRFKAVDKLSFKTFASEIFGLLGPNGAGKTTTIRTLATILQPTSGTAEVMGFDIRKTPEEVRKHIGVLTTDIGLYDRFSGRENLTYYGKLYRLEGKKLENRINELIRLLEMKDFIDRRAGKYSTGMKQKVAIARSVIHNPEILIYDEPTSGLDVLASQTVMKFMRRSKEQGKCVILSTHLMYDAQRLCDRIAIIHKGKLIELDNPDKLNSRYKTENLEDTFLEIIKKKNLEDHKNSNHLKETKKSKTFNLKKVVRIIIIIALLLQIVVMPFLT